MNAGQQPEQPLDQLTGARPFLARRKRLLSWLLAAAIFIVVGLLVSPPFMFSRTPRMPTTTTITTAVEFDPAFEWPFQLDAADAPTTNKLLEKFLTALKAELKTRNITVKDARNTQGAMLLTVRIPNFTRVLTVRLIVCSAAETIGAGCGQTPLSWQGTLYADIATFRQLSTGDESDVESRLDTLAGELSASAAAAGKATPGVTEL